MKKIVLMAAVAMLTADMVSCKKSDDGRYTPEQKAMDDSLSVSVGNLFGAKENNQYHQMLNYNGGEVKDFDRKEFLRGLELALTTDSTNQGFIRGLQVGAQLNQMLLQFAKEHNYPIDSKLVYKAFEEVYMADSIVNGTPYEVKLNTITQKILEQEAAARKAASEKLIKELAATGDYQTSPTGLVYKIDNPGSETKVQPTDIVTVEYKGKHADGKVFDEGEIPGAPAGYGFVPGFIEAMSLLGEGGSGTFILPSELAYGSHGYGPIGPDETLIFEITIKEVKSAEAQQ